MRSLSGSVKRKHMTELAEYRRQLWKNPRLRFLFIEMTNRCNEHVGEVLDMPLANGLKKLDIFVDRSSVEYFANDGEATFAAHSYPTAEEFHYTACGDVQVKIWKLKASVKDDFVV